MRKFAYDLSDTVHALGTMEAIGVKVASANSCMESQNVVAQCSSDLYSVMYKRAMAETFIGEPSYIRVAAFIDKVASIVGKEKPPVDLQYKIAAAVLADDTLCEMVNNCEDAIQKAKYAECRSYGREFVAELLRKAI